VTGTPSAKLCTTVAVLAAALVGARPCGQCRHGSARGTPLLRQCCALLLRRLPAAARLHVCDRQQQQHAPAACSRCSHAADISETRQTRPEYGIRNRLPLMIPAVTPISHF
jgi:hypothetical protein